MTGLNLETFLQLLRVAPGAWASLGVAVILLALMTWTSWGSRRALRKCLFLSIAAHFALISYGGSSPEIQRFFRLGSKPPKPAPAIERIRVTSVEDPPRPNRDRTAPGQSGRPVSAWDRDGGSIALADASRLPPRPDRPDSTPAPLEPPKAAEASLPIGTAPDLAAPDSPAPEPTALASPAQAPEPIAAAVDPGEGGVGPTPEPTPAADLVAPPTVAVGVTVGEADLRSRSRPRPAPTPSAAPTVPAALASGAPALAMATPLSPPERDLIAPLVPPPTPAGPPTESGRPVGGASAAAPALTGELDEPAANPPTDPAAIPPVAAVPDPAPSLLPEANLRRSIRPGPGVNAAPPPTLTRPPDSAKGGANLSNLARATPSIASAIPTLPKATGRRPLAEVPSVYRSRLDPNRTILAQRSGASQASEQAVERALDWLARHQDPDGRWDGGTVKFRDGHVAETDDTFTIHCPPGDICFGECIYGEADTALTGLSLLAYLGAGYTHVDGKYTDTVARGINFLRQSQKPDGDLRQSFRSDGELRGVTLSVGMYCHAMATLALCEAYALTGDPAIRPAVEKGVAFLIQSRAVDGLAWRYAPGAPTGDTSILGWVVMALKSAKTVGIAVPPTIQSGIATWLNQVSDGRQGGLARYQPAAGVKVTPTMTAEAWACRQFLELGGPGPASDEAAASLLDNPKDRGEFNVYYLYYGTLAMYQHGGSPWAKWNAQVRDQVVGRQQTKGHKAGSWDPDDSPYGTHGGRIYSTALATLTLEVYYRFLRLYSPADAANPLAPRPADTGARRAGFNPPRSPAGR